MSKFSETIELNRLKNQIVNLLDYIYSWEEFDPYCPDDESLKVIRLKEEIKTLLNQVEDKMCDLSSINRDCYEY